LPVGESELPYEFDDGNIAFMGRDPIQNQTPDLFSSQTGPSPNQAAEAPTGRPSHRPALPKDLPKAIRYLADRELDWLLRTAIEEAKRRGRPVPTGAVGPTKTDTVATPKSPERKTRRGQIGGAAAVTQGQMNAVRAAFKAGVTPSRIARQFGLSHSDVRKALSSDESER
jgi:hypothetical protein